MQEKCSKIFISKIYLTLNDSLGKAQKTTAEQKEVKVQVHKTKEKEAADKIKQQTEDYQSAKDELEGKIGLEILRKE